MKRFIFPLLIIAILALSSCTPADSSDSNSSGSGVPNWDGKRITYTAEDISSFGSATPSGVANYDESNDTVVIWNTDASLDNYGGVQTPMLALDFSKAVIFEMGVVSCYSQYVIKLAVEGVNETFYVLADEGDTGLISVNLVDSMLSEKFFNRRTSPDPGYENGWWYEGMSKKCSFHILAKGPDGERQTAELVLSHLSIYNDVAAVTGVEVQASGLTNNTISKLKGSSNVVLNGSVLPLSIEDQTIIWSSDNSQIASITATGILSFIDVGQTIITAILLYFVGTYNDLYGPALYISDKSNWVMANSITIFENLYQSGSSSYIVPWNYVSVATLIAMIPVVLLFALLQKQFMQSVAGTGIKG